jgi:phosphatidate phosphatase APP1
MLRGLIRRARDPVIILPYAGFGTRRRAVLCGRVLQDEGIRPAASSDGRLHNLAAFFKRLESDEVPGARVRARVGRRSFETVSDREGYFRFALERPAGEIRLELVRNPGISATAPVFIPSARARFGIISDIDDTIVRTNVTRRVKMLLTVALTNAHTRKPFGGAAAFYRALHAGVNPVFYVSKSPWNLYPVLVDFLRIQGLPDGPLLLRDFGFRMEKRHKEENIEAILATYPGMSFVLIGDSGEADPEIYREVVRRHPERIRAIYIRSVDPDPRRIAAIGTLSREVAQTGCQLVLAADSLAAAAHAAGEGLIQPSDLRAVRADCRSDASMPSKVAASTGSLK